jgi:hypothetical protein
VLAGEREVGGGGGVCSADLDECRTEVVAGARIRQEAAQTLQLVLLCIKLDMNYMMRIGQRMTVAERSRDHRGRTLTQFGPGVAHPSPNAPAIAPRYKVKTIKSFIRL